MPRTIKADHIRRTHDRAATIPAATPEETVVAVIGAVIPPPHLPPAAEIGVREIIPPVLRQDGSYNEATILLC